LLVAEPLGSDVITHPAAEGMLAGSGLSDETIITPRIASELPPETLTVTVNDCPAAGVWLDANIVIVALLSTEWHEPPQSYSSVPLPTPFLRASITGEMSTSKASIQTAVINMIFFLKATLPTSCELLSSNPMLFSPLFRFLRKADVANRLVR
jgi:hypothetical protein